MLKAKTNVTFEKSKHKNFKNYSNPFHFLLHSAFLFKRSFISTKQASKSSKACLWPFHLTLHNSNIKYCGWSPSRNSYYWQQYRLGLECSFIILESFLRCSPTPFWYLWHELPPQNGTNELKQYCALLSDRNKRVCWFPFHVQSGNRLWLTFPSISYWLRCRYCAFVSCLFIHLNHKQPWN